MTPIPGPEKDKYKTIGVRLGALRAASQVYPGEIETEAGLNDFLRVCDELVKWVENRR